ncbi:MAG: TrbC/VirB2 family protein [Candidatus Paceibacterota bacterium]|jgi:hypothetical protein
MKFINKSWQKIIFLVYVFIVPVISLADGPNTDPTQGKIINPIPSITSISGLVQKILEGVLMIGIPIIALAIIYCGFLFVKAQGNSEELTKAKDALVWTLIGAGILLGSFAIAKMIEATVKGLL